MDAIAPLPRSPDAISDGYPVDHTIQLNHPFVRLELDFRTNIEVASHPCPILSSTLWLWPLKRFLSLMTTRQSEI